MADGDKSEWVVGAVMVALAAIISLPFAEQRRLPLASEAPNERDSQNIYKWPPLSRGEALELKLALMSIPKKERFRVICVENECRELALTFFSALAEADWDPQAAFSGSFQNTVGIILYQTNANDRVLADAIDRATTGRLKVKVKPTDFPGI